MVQKVISIIRSRTSSNVLKVKDYVFNEEENNVYLIGDYKSRRFNIPIIKDVSPVGGIGERYVKIYDDYFFIDDASDKKGAF